VTPVSVCVPVFNRRDGLERSLESVIGQEDVELEVVVGDNASTDGSLALARDYAQRDSRIRVLAHPANLGPLENWRACLTAAAGPFVKYLGSDDELLPGALHRLTRELEDDSAAFVYAGIEWTLQDGSQRLYYAAPADGTIASETFLREAATMLDAVPTTLASVLVRRSDALAALERPRAGALSGATVGSITLWHCCERYPVVRRLATALVATDDTHRGAPTARTQGEKARRSLWWAHRSAFGEFLADAEIPADLRTELRALLFLSAVPLGRRGFSAAAQRMAAESEARWQDVVAAAPRRSVRRSLLRRVRRAPSVDEVDW